MASTLVIVESPAKSKKIQQILGSNYVVKASVGHMRDLPQHDLGVDLETLKPTYEISPDKKAVVADLRKLVKRCPKVVLATDPDREGEAIAYHLRVALGLPADVERVSYQEVTESAIKKALANPSRIDTDLVAAQESRRVLDRLIGYLVSPALTKQAGINLSAGRVQSVAVRTVVDREREIESFKPRGYQSVTLALADYNLKAPLDLKPFVAEGERLWHPEQAKPFLGSQKVQLGRLTEKPSEVKPRPPFTTVTMQSAAGKLYGMSASQVMQAAQKLFEQGAITYHRTDSPNLSEEGIAKAQHYLQSQGLPIAQKVAKYKMKAGAQEAHEAVRPTDIALEVAGQTDSEKQLYKLIRERALLSVMPVGVDNVTKMTFVSERKVMNRDGDMVNPTFSISGRMMHEKGWRAYVQVEPISAEDKPLPKLTKGTLFSGMVTAKEEYTKPPSRYNEQSLIKALESAGIGRPSTYAAIMENIKGRKYIIPETGSKAKSPNFRPGKLGFYIVDALSEFQFMGYKYTRGVESSLDKVAAGKMGYLNIVRPVLQGLQEDIASRLKGGLLAENAPCPGCGQIVIQKTSNKGRGKSNVYWMHLDPGHADSCHKYLNDNAGSPSLPEPEQRAECPNCSKDVLRKKRADGGAFWVHADKSHVTACGHKYLDDRDGAPALKPKAKTEPCSECGAVLKRIYSRKKEHWLWVHDDNDNPECGSKFVDDVDGRPANAGQTAS
ncbi:MAG: DNA topoisomerase I [Marinobacter sp. T13-3]|nr:MAG: DNA topoisomerase I [Marinobacter sp. T13-3]